MRAVALSNAKVQKELAAGFVPFNLRMTYPKQGPFPLDWPAMENWREAYAKMDGKGFTGCAVVSHDLQIQYAHSGSAMVWELFDSAAYDADKFLAMLVRGRKRAAEERKLRTATATSAAQKTIAVAKWRAELARQVAKEGPFQLPPRGFRIRHATELFRMSGDL